MAVVEIGKPGINQLVIEEMERVLQRSLTPEEVRFLMLSEVARQHVEPEGDSEDRAA